ncbi:MAG: response regulator [Campylobacteraceae bacterium]|nr:response regulator [Campylobacteraceae bacterium]
MGENSLASKEFGRNYNLLGQFNVLYIEDELSLFRHISDALSDFVKKIYGALNAKEAYSIIRSENIDAIISDIMLRNENSLGFLRYLRFELGIKTPIIITSVFSDTNTTLDAIKLNAESYIVKPTNMKDLLDCLYDALLPKIQQREIKNFNEIIKTATIATGNKQVETIRFIIKNLDESSVLNYSCEDIAKHVHVDKNAIVKTFKQLLDNNILVKIGNKKYFFDKDRLL